MVGYYENDPMTTTQKLIAGVFSGVVTRFVTQPMDVIKVRAQLVKRIKRGSIMARIAKKIYLDEGLKAFWQGHAMGQVHSVMAVGSQFYVYELTTRYVAAYDFAKANKTAVNFICGIVSGCVSTTLVIPLEVIRVRQILVHDQYGGFLNGAKNVYASGGIKAFYEGLSASLLQMGPSVAISFTTFTLAQHFILHWLATAEDHQKGINKFTKPENMIVASSIAGSIAGFISKTATYPFDLIKKRLQIRSHVTSDKYNVPDQVKQLVNCTSITDCIYKSYKKEGLKGFFRGWTVTVYKSQLTSIVAFTTYEMYCHFVRNFINNH